jgi:hypothetical protein
MKTCRKCNVELVEGESVSPSANKKKCVWCSACQSEYYKMWYAKNREIQKIRMRENNIKKYGITIADHNKLIADQGGRCAICENDLSRKLCIDHCHTTGAVRGMLCYRCNSAVGFYEKHIRYYIHKIKKYLREEE